MLAIDSQFLSSDALAAYHIKPRTHHKRQVVNALLNDGSVQVLNNSRGQYTLDLRSNADLYDAFNRILRSFENAESEE